MICNFLKLTDNGWVFLLIQQTCPTADYSECSLIPHTLPMNILVTIESAFISYYFYANFCNKICYLEVFG